MRDLYQEVTDRIVAAVEAGTPPWVRPWSVGSLRPRNAATERPYRGINQLLLGLEAYAKGYPESRWLTFLQASRSGARIRHGERGTTVVFYKLETLPEASSDGGEPRRIPLLRSFTVFNVAQVEGLPEVPMPTAAWDPHGEAETVIVSSGAKIHHGGEQAYYHPGRDEIHLPHRHAFADQRGYYATALHELVHWTGHEARCQRDLKSRFGDLAYAAEELIAEIGSAFLCAHCRMDGTLQHPAYVGNWLRVLKGDKRAIFTASAKAQAAADYLLGTALPAEAQEAA